MHHRTGAEQPMEIKYFREDPLLPIYASGNKSMKTKYITEEIVNGRIESNRIAKLVPNQPSDNLCFMIGLDYLEHWKDCLSDNLGVWTQTGTKSLFYSSSLNRTHDVALKAESECGENTSVKCMRFLYSHQTCKTFKRIVMKVSTKNEDSAWVDRSPVFVQYYFENEKENISVPCHGNSKKKEVPFFRSKESTKIAIKAKVDPLLPSNVCNAKRIFNEMITEKGGLTKITSPADIPRNREQIRNCRKNSTEKHDDLTILLFKCKEESKTNDPFLREVGAAPELHVFLCNSVQLNDIKRFCCNDINSSILGVDMTFNIGHYYVTVTIYRHKMLLTDRGVEPCMIGPVLVHQRKSFQSYYALPSLMIKHCPDLKDLQAIGTDGELALINAMKIVFSNSLHLQCDLHMKENIEHKMGECGMDSFLSSKVIFNIFGRQIGTSKLKGLVDCTTEEDFDSMLTTSVEEWKTLGVPDTFKTYFEEEKSHLIRNTMTANVRARAGLGNPPDMYRQQGNESLNNVIKRELHKKMSLVQFVDHLELLVHHQQQEVNLAIIGRGCYILKDEYKDEYGIKETVFYQKTEEQKKHCINKFNRGPVITKPALPRATIETNNSISRLTPSVTVAISSVTQHPIAPRSPVVNTLVSSEIPEFGPADANGTLITGHSLHINDSSSQHEKSGSNTSSANKLSVTALQSQIQIPQEILSPMFKKASDLIANDNVNREPTLDEQFRVKSYSSPNTPHTLCMKGLKISCDSSCEGFTAYKLCAHSLAVAQFTGKLDNYIKSYNSHPKSSPNLYKLCSVGMSESRGKKATKSTNKRKFGPRKSASAKKTILDIVSPSKSRDSQVSATVSSSFESSFSSLSPDKPQKYLTCIPPKNVLATIFKGLTIPDQPVVPLGTGRSLGVIPPQPEPQEQPYELLTRRGNISKCNGCGNNFDKCDTELFILGRTEFDWYPKIDRTNKTKFYKVSSAKNYYYCCLKRCVLMRRPMLTIPKIVYSGDTSVRAEMLKFIKEQFGIDDLFYNWMF